MFSGRTSQARGKEPQKPCYAAINALKQEARAFNGTSDNEAPNGIGKMEASNQQAVNKDINFGWFTLPGAVPDAELGARTDRIDDGVQQVPGSRAGYPPDPRSTLQSRGANRQPSQLNNGLFAGPNYQGPPPKTGYRPRTQQSQVQDYGCGAQAEGAERLVVDHPACDIGQGEGPSCSAADDAAQGLDADSYVMDWPMSSAAQEYLMMARRQGGGEYQGRRPGTQGCKIPPTPMPPLTWGGGHERSRPTFATWHDQWHMSNNCQHKPTSHVSDNINFNNCSSATSEDDVPMAIKCASQATECKKSFSKL